MMLPLFLTALAGSGRTLAVDQASRKARLAELRSRLGVAEGSIVPTLPPTVVERFLAPAIAWPEWIAWGTWLPMVVDGVRVDAKAHLPYPSHVSVTRLLPYRDVLVRWVREVTDPSFDLRAFYMEGEPLANEDDPLANQRRAVRRYLDVEALVPRELNEIEACVNRWKKGLGLKRKQSETTSFPLDDGLAPWSVDIGVRLWPWEPVVHEDRSHGWWIRELLSMAATYRGKQYSPTSTWPASPGMKVLCGGLTNLTWRYSESTRSGSPWTVLHFGTNWMHATKHEESAVVDVDRRLTDSFLDQLSRQVRWNIEPNAVREFLRLWSSGRPNSDDFREFSDVDAPAETLSFLAFMARAKVHIQLAQQRADLVAGVFTRFLSPILDWADMEHVALDRLSLVDAIRGGRAWHRSLAGSSTFGIPPVSGGVVLLRWADGSTLQLLDSRIAIRDEGTSMGHCVGGPIDRLTGRAPGESHYIQAARDGKGPILSYRDGAGLPRATLELGPGGLRGMGAQARQVVHVAQAQGPQDGPVDAFTRSRLWALLSPEDPRHNSVRALFGFLVEFSVGSQANEKLNPAGQWPVDPSMVPVEHWEELETWRAGCTKSLTVDSPSSLVGACTREGIAILDRLFDVVGISCVVTPDPGDDGEDTELTINANGYPSFLLYMMRVSHGSPISPSWRVSTSLPAGPSAMAQDPWTALAEIGFVYEARQDESTLIPAFVAPSFAWKFPPWSTPSGTPTSNPLGRIP